MAQVVFLRGVNVGGHKAFRPGVLAKEMSALDVVNVGAAGTFVIRKSIGAASARAELLRRLPFEAEMMICPSREVLDLVSANPFPAARPDEGLTRYVSVLASRPRTTPRFPLLEPAGGEWEVKILGVSGRFAPSLHRRVARGRFYPNEVVEKRLGVAATTRNWNTIVSIAGLLTGAR
jgi:uncharacterized protein (DUF1697 family)